MLFLLKSFILIPVIIGFLIYKIISQEREQNIIQNSAFALYRSSQTPLDWMGVCHQRFDWYQVSSLLVSSNLSIIFLAVTVLWVMILQTSGGLSCGHFAIQPKLVECSDS